MSDRLPWEAEEIDLSGLIKRGEREVPVVRPPAVNAHVEGEMWQIDLNDDEDDFLSGKTCNPDAPEECESCQ
uniref:Uncharacterized protein n=3 Tax=unclassified bacterial viruses TaxID=12333 RepID=A0AAU6VZX0_9VIRU